MVHSPSHDLDTSIKIENTNQMEPRRHPANLKNKRVQIKRGGKKSMKVIISLKASMDYRTCVSHVSCYICVREVFCTLDIQVISLLHRIELCLFKLKVW